MLSASPQHNELIPDEGSKTSDKFHYPSAPTSSRTSILNGKEGDASSKLTEESSHSELPLSALEQAAPRRFKRLSMVLPWSPYDENYLLPVILRKTHGSIVDALYHTICQWPFLAGEFHVSDADPTKLRLVYPRASDKGKVKFLVEMDEPPKSSSGLINSVNPYELVLDSFGKSRFTSVTDLEDVVPFPPFTIKISFQNEMLVLGFAFSEVIFDLEFIKNFLHSFGANTYPHSAIPPCVPLREHPNDVDDDLSDWDTFPWYDWESNVSESPAPQHRLLHQIVTLTASSVRKLYGLAQDARKEQESSLPMLYEDCIMSLFWVTIMQARHENGRFDLEEDARLNIAIPGAEHVRYPPRGDKSYFGNSTITALALCEADEMLTAPGIYGRQLLRGYLDVRKYATGAQLVRKAIDDISSDTLRSFRAYMEDVLPEQATAASEFALQRHHDSLTFENWASLAEQPPTGLDGMASTKPSYLPCFDDLREGDLIILPRKGGSYGNDHWNVSVCLAEEDMDRMIYRLDQGGWLVVPKEVKEHA